MEKRIFSEEEIQERIKSSLATRAKMLDPNNPYADRLAGWREKQIKFEKEFGEATPSEKITLKEGDVFINFWNGVPYAEYSKGIVVEEDLENNMVTYIPTEDNLGAFGFGCMHRVITHKRLGEVRIIGNNLEMRKRLIRPVAAPPNLFRNPSFDLVNM